MTPPAPNTTWRSNRTGLPIKVVRSTPKWVTCVGETGAEQDIPIESFLRGWVPADAPLAVAEAVAAVAEAEATAGDGTPSPYDRAARLVQDVVQDLQAAVCADGLTRGQRSILASLLVEAAGTVVAFELAEEPEAGL